MVVADGLGWAVGLAFEVADVFAFGAELPWAAGLELGLTAFVVVGAELVLDAEPTPSETGLAATVAVAVDLAVEGVTRPPPESLVVSLSAAFVSLSDADLLAVAVAFVVEERVLRSVESFETASVTSFINALAPTSARGCSLIALPPPGWSVSVAGAETFASLLLASLVPEVDAMVLLLASFVLDVETLAPLLAGLALGAGAVVPLLVEAVMGAKAVVPLLAGAAPVLGAAGALLLVAGCTLAIGADTAVECVDVLAATEPSASVPVIDNGEMTNARAVVSATMA